LRKRNEFRFTRAKLAQDGIGKFAVDLDVLLAGDRVALVAIGRAGVAQEIAEDIREEIEQQLLLFKRVGPSGSDQFGPMLQVRPAGLDLRGQAEARKVHTEHVRAEKRLSFEGHGNPLLW
jgi:hypothetical protein